MDGVAGGVGPEVCIHVSALILKYCKAIEAQAHVILEGAENVFLHVTSNENHMFYLVNICGVFLAL